MSSMFCTLLVKTTTARCVAWSSPMKEWNPPVPPLCQIIGRSGNRMLINHPRAMERLSETSPIRGSWVR